MKALRALKPLSQVKTFAKVAVAQSESSEKTTAEAPKKSPAKKAPAKKKAE